MKRIQSYFSLLIVMIPCSLLARTELVFKNKGLDRHFELNKKSISLTDERNRTRYKALSANQVLEIKSEWLETLWSAKQFNKTLKLKCQTYAELTVDNETERVCLQDAKNKNILFSSFNKYQSYFK